MPGGYKVSDDGKLLFVKWQGSLSDQRVIDHVGERFQDSRLHDGPTEAIDLRSAVVDTGVANNTHLDNVNDLATAYARVMTVIRIAKILIIVPDQRMFEFASQFRLLMANRGVDVILFSSTQSLSYFLPHSSEELEKIFTGIHISDTGELRRQA